MAIAVVALAGSPAAQPARIVSSAERLVAAGTPDEIQVRAACWSDGPYRQVRLFGAGLGIWNTDAQFSLPRGAIGTVLQAFREADFDAMPTIYGGDAERVAAHAAPTIICQVSLTAGSATKEVIQRDRGRQSAPLRTLANAILDLSERAAAVSVTASSLDDGLTKIADGRLAPDTLNLTVNHRDARTPGRVPGGWILRVDGHHAIAEVSEAVSGERRVRALRLSATDVADLARTLRAEDAAALPGNVYFADYTDLDVAVLNREHQVQARQFSGMAPDRQARGQTAFGRLLSALAALHGRVIEQGQPIG